MLHPQEAFERAVMSPVRYSATTYLLYVLATRGPWRG
jgi:hypothetical protein